jgi:glycosyltransferase involved in cell wall biosynthesis
MIPKIIHWCWFDRGDKKPLPRLVEDCIASWKKYCPEWEIKLWNETNFDITINDFTCEAYAAGKLGFVPDWIRAYLLYTYGGVYFDADMELLQPIDFMLENKAFTGNENIFRHPDGTLRFCYLGNGMIGAEKEHPYFRAVMNEYEKRRFINPDGSLNIWCTSNFIYNKAFVDMYGTLKPETQTYCEGDSALTVYSKDVVYPHNRHYVKPETVAIHHCMASWITPVSVVMPCYNAEKTIREAIDSVLNQTLTKFEFIIIDDGSTDETVDIIKSYKDRRIVLLENGHNYIESLNAGMRRASSNYIARMDADDVMATDRLQTQYDYMQTHKEIDVLGSGMRFFGDRDAIFSPPAGNISFASMLDCNRIAHPTVMIRRESLKRLQEMYREEYIYAEDYDLWLRMLEAGMTLHNIPDVLLHYRKHANQITHKHETQSWETVKRIKKRYNTGLTVIIPFLNEGVEVERTVQSVIETSAVKREIILINDCSTDEYDYPAVATKYGCRYVEHTDREGVAASRDEGVELCNTPYFILLDAHMEFYKKGWDVDVTNALQENQEAVLCCQTKVLHETRKNVSENSPATFGAYLSLSKKDVFKCTWNLNDHNPDSNIIEIPVVLGGAYAAGKSYWQQLHGLNGLIGYGLDEELISIKTWVNGGRCLLLKNVVAGHIYRGQFPYPVKNDYLLANRILVIELFFDGEMKQTLFDRLKSHYGKDFFEQVYNERNKELIENEKQYLQSIARKDLTYFLFKNETLK